jgi:hypothetical protein
MNDDVEFGDIEVLDHDGSMLWCRIAGRTVAVPSLRFLSGTQIRATGDRGKLVLPREVAENLGLIARL